MKEETYTVNPEMEKKNKSAKTGLILGLCSIIAWIIPLIGYPVTICGIVYSANGLGSEKKKANAIAGMILSIIFLLATLLNSLLGVLMNLGVI